jgi:hypothetical protein
MIRKSFMGGAAALAACACAIGARTASAENGTASGTQTTDDAQTMLVAVAAITAAQRAVKLVWRPPSLFPPDAPVAAYVGLGGDGMYPNDRVIWMNPDHPELISPRLSHVNDDVPLMTELLLASVDVPAAAAPALGLGALHGTGRREAAFGLATRLAVVAQFSPFERVDDAEFARRTFAFAVLRQMTPGIGGVATLTVAVMQMPPTEPLVAYAGRDIDPRAPRGWGVIYMTSASPTKTPPGYDAWVRAFVLATADREPLDSEIKRAYDDARRRDDEAGGGEANRRAFAEPYVRQVAALNAT